MGWVSKKVYAILSNDEEGKKILEGIGEKDQDTVDKEVDGFFNKTGQSNPDKGKQSANPKKTEKAKGNLSDEQAKRFLDAAEDSQRWYHRQSKDDPTDSGKYDEQINDAESRIDAIAAELFPNEDPSTVKDFIRGSKDWDDEAPREQREKALRDAVLNFANRGKEESDEANDRKYLDIADQLEIEDVINELGYSDAVEFGDGLDRGKIFADETTLNQIQRALDEKGYNVDIKGGVGKTEENDKSFKIGDDEYKLEKNENGGDYRITRNGGLVRNTGTPNEEDAKEFFRDFKKEIEPFKLNKEQYPDVEETSFDFLYRIGDSTITDLAAQERFWYGPGRDVEDGFAVYKDGEEIYYDTFDEAYQAIKENDKDMENAVDEFIDAANESYKLYQQGNPDEDENLDEAIANQEMRIDDLADNLFPDLSYGVFKDYVRNPMRGWDDEKSTPEQKAEIIKKAIKHFKQRGYGNQKK